MVLVALWMLWRAATVLLVVFGGIILALALRGAAAWLAARAALSTRVAVLLLTAVIVATVALLGWVLADDVARQFQALVERLPRAVDRLKEHLARREWGRLVLANLPTSLTPDLGAISGGNLTSILGASFGVVAYVAVAAFVAIYVALDPDVYRRGVLAVVPARARRRADQALHAMALALRRWVVGRLVAMVAIGALTALGLWLIGVPLALTLGLLAGVLNFIPYIGPVASFVPAGLMALLHGPTAVVWVLALYVVVQTVESYLVTPLVQQRAVRLPPALTITAQVVLGLVFGGVGLLFATPLTAAAVVLVQLLYVEDVLHEDADVRGATSRRAPAA
jgi:predicted PurR-regulated permease PerM